jgi:hypothetical protein
MLLFRAEEHVRRWCELRGLSRGAVFAPEQMWTVAKPWHGRRLEPGWRRFTPDEAEAVFEGAGLTGTFWQFPRPPAAGATRDGS